MPVNLTNKAKKQLLLTVWAADPPVRTCSLPSLFINGPFSMHKLLVYARSAEEAQAGRVSGEMPAAAAADGGAAASDGDSAAAAGPLLPTAPMLLQGLAFVPEHRRCFLGRRCESFYSGFGSARSFVLVSRNVL